jgi:hypothetical protein
MDRDGDVLFLESDLSNFLFIFIGRLVAHEGLLEPLLILESDSMKLITGRQSHLRSRFHHRQSVGAKKDVSVDGWLGAEREEFLISVDPPKILQPDDAQRCAIDQSDPLLR